VFKALREHLKPGQLVLDLVGLPPGTVQADEVSVEGLCW
jgi:hypothetical protein